MKALFFATLALVLVPFFGAFMFLSLATPGWFWFVVGAATGTASLFSMLYAEVC